VSTGFRLQFKKESFRHPNEGALLCSPTYDRTVSVQDFAERENRALSSSSELELIPKNWDAFPPPACGRNLAAGETAKTSAFSER